MLTHCEHAVKDVLLHLSATVCLLKKASSGNETQKVYTAGIMPHITYGSVLSLQHIVVVHLYYVI